jgi:6,7-dimethyl-8-ribityllumazine synthase
MKKKNKILIVSARYYAELMNKMEADAKLILEKNDDLISEYSFFEVPGVFEIPVVLSKFINKFDGFITLGCVIKGETPHFDFISTATTDAIMKISIDNKKPVGNGILTCLNKEQAKIRSKLKGREAAEAVISVLGNLPIKEYSR